MFLLMFRSERLDFTRPALAGAAKDASLLLMRSAQPAGPEDQHAGGLAGLSRPVGRWSVVHGFAMLLIDGRLNGALASPDCHGDVGALLDLALAS